MRTVVYLRKSNKPNKKWMVTIGNKTIHFGQRTASDFLKNKDTERKARYIQRHKARENWGKSGIKTAGFWSRWLLWNKPTIGGSKRDIAKRFQITFSSKKPKKSKSPR